MITVSVLHFSIACGTFRCLSEAPGSHRLHASIFHFYFLSIDMKDDVEVQLSGAAIEGV